MVELAIDYRDDYCRALRAIEPLFYAGDLDEARRLFAVATTNHAISIALEEAHGPIDAVTRLTDLYGKPGIIDDIVARAIKVVNNEQ